MSQPKAKPDKPKPTILVIAFDNESNCIKVDGPYEDGVKFLGMLDMARVVYIENRARAQTIPDKGNIIVPKFGAH